MKRAKSIFLWCGEFVEQWRGWLPYWGFCSKKSSNINQKTPPKEPLVKGGFLFYD